MSTNKDTKVLIARSINDFTHNNE